MYEYRIHEVLRVVDGDTIDVAVDLGFDVLKKVRIRLSGIDCPETKNMKEYEGTCLKQIGDDATAFVEQRLSLCNELIFNSLEFDGKYGRSVGDIMMDGISLSKTLIGCDLAIPYISDKEKRLDEMIKLNNRVKHKYEKI